MFPDIQKSTVLAATYSPAGKPCSTIGLEELNDRVRYGNGCGLFSIVTRTVLFWKNRFLIMNY